MFRESYVVQADGSGATALAGMAIALADYTTAAELGVRIAEPNINLGMSRFILTEQDHLLLMAALYQSSEFLYQF